MTNFDSDKPTKPGTIRRIIDAFVYILGIVILIIVVFPRFNILRFLAVDGASFEAGESNAQRFITAAEQYKLEQGQYPINKDELIYYHYLDIPSPRPAPNQKYEYDVFPSQDNRQEYMLSFRIKWSIGGWYCYYSEDGQWLKSYFTCWTSPRPQKTSSE